MLSRRTNRQLVTRSALQNMHVKLNVGQEAHSNQRNRLKIMLRLLIKHFPSLSGHGMHAHLRDSQHTRHLLMNTTVITWTPSRAL